MVINLQILGQRWKFRANIISSGIIKLKACFVAEHVTLKYIPRTSNHTWVRNNIFLFQNSSTNTIHSNDIQRSIDFSKIGKVKRGGKMENLSIDRARSDRNWGYPRESNPWKSHSRRIRQKWKVCETMEKDPSMDGCRGRGRGNGQTIERRTHTANGITARMAVGR